MAGRREWTRIAAVVVLTALGALSGQVSQLVLAVLAGVVAVAVAASDRALHPSVTDRSSGSS